MKKYIFKDIQNNLSSKQISIDSFLKDIDYKKVVLKPKETLSTIARKYTSTCNPNTTINLIKLLNNLTDLDNLDEGTALLIPHKTLQNGSLYKVKKGNTLDNIWETSYPEYDSDHKKSMYKPFIKVYTCSYFYLLFFK